jgi:hypothetical protein
MSDETSATNEGVNGYITLLPYVAREGGSVEAMIAMTSPWGAPAASALQGANENGEPWLGIVNEIPLNWLRVGKPVSKQEIELLHLQRLAVDCKCATGTELFDAILPGEDPPDLYALAGERRVGWELTTLTIQQRRQAQSLFFEVTARMTNQQRHRIGHLTGYHVFMWFGGADDPAGLPFQKHNNDAYDRLVESLVSYYPDPEQFKVSGSELPQQLTGVGPVRTPEDVSFIAVPLLGGVPASGLFAMTGVSAGLAFQSDHTTSQEWARLREMIYRKDREENSCLLISVGAPDRMGRCFISEEVLAHFLLAHPEAVSATHLSSVVLHFWSSGHALELLGEAPTVMWPPLYQGFSPSSHPFLAVR